MAARKPKKTRANLKRMNPLPRRFAEVKDNGEGRGIFYFHNPGDFLYGYLLCKETVQTLHYPFTTFKIKALEGRQDGCDLVIAEDGQVFEIPANIVPRRIIDDHELIGSLVEIVFTGKRGRKKDYEVSADKGTFYKDLEQKHGKSKRTRKRKPKARAGIAATA